ncbi:MAG TPA: hypothetical protein VL551_09065 [Actinospica sp.]|jgi:hypothetical protein|nr:hypothetical protein [Actinospica sp.]
MTFCLVPGTGLVLPKNAGTLRFGMTEHAAQWTASTLAEVRDGGWMCKTHWNFLFAHQGITVTAYSCTSCLSCADQTLGHLLVERDLLLPANINPRSTHYLPNVRLDACEPRGGEPGPD